VESPGGSGREAERPGGVLPRLLQVARLYKR
jgi:hypothetical protein